MLPVYGPVSKDVDFTHELKWDGYRVLAHVDADDVVLLSRNGHSLNDRFPRIVDSLKKRKLQSILDGEVVALTAEGKVDFSLLHRRSPVAHVCYIVFDVLQVQGQSLCPRPWMERRQHLEDLLPSEGVLLLSPLLPGSAKDNLAFAISQGFEGIVSKRRDSPYLPGTRSSTWLKQKRRRSLDCVFVGIKKTQGRLRSAAVGAYGDDGSLLYLGNVGSGFGEGELNFLEEAVWTLGTLKHCPCVNPPTLKDHWIWCKPFLVLEIEYFELTPSRRLRHPVFRRFRFDKEARDCQVEV